MAGRDITEGRAARSIAIDLGIGTGTIWQNTDVAYDFAIGGVPFLNAIKDATPYERATAQFRKQQFDSQRDPGEQSLSHWWIRSQSSFHTGEGISYYDPFANQFSTTLASNSYRIKSAYGVNIWTPGQVSLLKQADQGHITTKEIYSSTGRVGQTMRSITWNGNQGFLLHDGYDIDRIDSAGTVENWVDYSPGVTDPVYALCDDGTTAYWVTNDTASGKLEVDKKLLTATSGVAATSMFTQPGITITNASMEYVKQRIVMAANNKIYEFPTSATALPTATYTHPNTSYIFTSIAESGTAIYVSGYSGVQSSIFKFTLDTTTGAMPVLSSAITAAEMPNGELVHKLFYYLGYMCIGTSKGIRVASIAADGSLTYGPLIVETVNPCYAFAARDRFVWCATGVTTDFTEPGLIRIDLSQENDTLRFAYAKDLHYDASINSVTTACAFIGNTNRIAFATAAVAVDTAVTNKALTSNVATLTMSSVHGLNVGDSVWVEGVGSPFDSTTGAETVLSVPTTTTFTYSRTTSNVTSTAVSSSTALVKIVGHVYSENATVLRTDGYVETGLIRYNTLEQKNFKRILAHGSFNYGSMSLQTVALDGSVYDVNSYDAVIGTPESTITQPTGAQDALGLRFHLYRDGTDSTTGPTFKGYQLKAVPATPRNRIIKVPLACFDIDTDKYNTSIGYEGYGFDKLKALEDIEAAGDVVTWQDFRTGEVNQCLIEELSFIDTTPPDKRLTNFQGVISLTIRTV